MNGCTGKGQNGNVEHHSRSSLLHSRRHKVLKPGIYRLRISPPYPGRPAPLRTAKTGLALEDLRVLYGGMVAAAAV